MQPMRDIDQVDAVTDENESRFVSAGSVAVDRSLVAAINAGGGGAPMIVFIDGTQLEIGRESAQALLPFFSGAAVEPGRSTAD